MRVASRAFKGPPPYAKDLNRLISSRLPTGKVVFQDSFEGCTPGSPPQQWSVSGDTGYSVVADSTFPLSGKLSVKFVTPATAGKYAGMERTIGALAPLGKWGLELSFRIVDDDDNSRLQLWFEDWNPDDYNYLQILQINSDGGIFYWNGAANVKIGEIAMPRGDVATGGMRIWNHLKAVYDRENKCWDRLTVNGLSFPDIHGQGTTAVYGGPTIPKRICVAPFIYNKLVAAAKTWFIDDVIFTSHE